MFSAHAKLILPVQISNKDNGQEIIRIRKYQITFDDYILWHM